MNKQTYEKLAYMTIKEKIPQWHVSNRGPYF